MNVLVVAPHCTLPPMDGSERHAYLLYGAMLARGATGAFLGRDVVLQNGISKAHRPAAWWRNRKLPSALWALATGKDYMTARHLHPGFVEAFDHQVAIERYDAIVFHFLFTAPLLRRVTYPVKVAVETHNDDWEVYTNHAQRTRNPLTRRLCAQSIRGSARALATLPPTAALIHVSETDVESHRLRRPEVAHWLVKNATATDLRTQLPDYSEKRKRVIFVGSLANKLNQDALDFFARRFWTELKSSVQMRVVGARPPRSVERLCEREGWELHPDVSDAQLRELYADSHFALMPFEYGQGSKNKLLEAIGMGVPVLSTGAGLCGFPEPPPLVRASEDPAEWRRIMEGTIRLEAAEIEAAVAYTKTFSWEGQAGIILQKLAELPLTLPA